MLWLPTGQKSSILAGLCKLNCHWSLFQRNNLPHMDKVNVHKAIMGHVQAMSTRPLFGGQGGARLALRLQLHEMQQIYFKVTTESTAKHISTLYLLCLLVLPYMDLLLSHSFYFITSAMYTQPTYHMHISFLHVYR